MNIVCFACKDFNEAKKISRTIISEKLAFCVNIIPKCNSIYRWKGKIEEAEETVVIVKTLQSLVGKTMNRIKELHSYEMPEIISWKIEASEKLLKWVTAELDT